MSQIYKITHIDSGNFYVGKTTKALKERFRKHLWTAQDGSQTHLHRAIRKYGLDSFCIESLEETDKLNVRERYWIEKLNPNYNMTEGGDGGDTSKSPNYIMGMKHRRDMSGNNNPMFGRSRTGEVRSNKSKQNISNGCLLAWNNENRKSEASTRVLGENNPMFGKTPSNAIPIIFDGVRYESLAMARRMTGHSEKYLKKNRDNN